MHKLILAIGVTGLLLGCGGKDNGFDKILKQGKMFKDKACACTEQACLDAVEKEAEAWAEKEMKNFKGKPTKAQAEAWDKVEAEGDACEAKIKAAENTKKATAMLATMTAIKDKMCACADQACGDKLQAEVNEHMKGMAEITPTPDQQKAAAAVGEEMTKCLAKLTPPPTEGDAPADGTAPAADGDAPAGN